MKDTVRITAIAAGGDGVARMGDGRVVFVPRTAPGDEVELEDLVVKARFARGQPGAVRTAGPDRVEPACPHYVRDRCGGCQLQHVSYGAQLRVKSAIVGDALRRIGKLEVEDPEVVEAVEEWRYRAKITLHVGPTPRRRDDGATVGRGAIGYHRFDRPGAVFPLVDCQIADLRLMDLWRALRGSTDLLPPRLEQLVLRLDREGRRHVVVESASTPWLEAERLRSALTKVGLESVVWWKPVDGAARVVAGPSTGFPATAFEQVNPDMGSLARSWAVEQLGPVNGALVWDLYGGVGDTAALLAARGARVVSVDADAAAVDWAKRRGDCPNTRWIAARAEDAVSRLESPAAVVVNPPRRGLDRPVTAALRGLTPAPRVAYLSFDPATLARDLSRLADRFRLVGLRAFDLFPQTAHVETVAVLEPR